MAKSKVNTKFVALVAVLLVVIVGLVAVMFGSQIASAFTDVVEQGFFEIPFPFSDNPPITSDDQLIDPDIAKTMDCDASLPDCDAQIKDDLPDFPPSPPVINPDLDLINKTDNDELMDSLNMTESSDDPPIDQIIDIIFEPQIIKVEANVVKIDSTLQRFNETLIFDIPFASLFVEDTSNIDFRNGFIELDLDVLTDPQTQINADGTFNVKINDIEIFPTDVGLQSNGLTDQDGKIKLKFIPFPLEITSDLFTFDFNANFEKFPDEKVSKLRFIIKTLNIDVGTEQNNGLLGQEIFSMDIFKDPIQILILDTQGNEIKSYPLDDRLLIRSDASSAICKITLNPPTSTGLPKAGGCSAPVRIGQTYDTTCGAGSGSVCVNFDPVIMPKIRVLDVEGNLFTESFAGATGVIIDKNLFRNTNYTFTSDGVSVGGSPVDFTIITPKSQKNYSYKCWTIQENFNYKRVTGGFNVATGYITWDYYTTTPKGAGTPICNFPK